MKLELTKLSLVILNIASICNGINFRNVTQRIGSVVCPHTNFCHFNGSKEIDNTTEQCCVQCSCDVDCYETQSCCPDRDAGADEDIIKPVCKGSLTKWGLYDLMDATSRYLVYDECPKNSETLDEKCRRLNGTDIADYIWVSDNMSGKIYQNRHCAVCHNVKEWIDWRVRTTCRNVLSAGFEEIVAILLTPDCNIINEAPEDIKDMTKKYTCYKATYSHCNQTGYWPAYDVDIAMACEFFNLTFSQTGGPSVTIYKNMFCYVCNINTPGNESSVCLSNNSVVRNPPLKFSALITFRSSDERKEPYCENEEHYDAYLDVCRPLSCPFGQSPYRGECQTVAGSTTGSCFDFSYTFGVMWEQSVNITRNGIIKPHELEEILSSVITQMSHYLIFETCGSTYFSCFVQEEAMKAETKVSWISVIKTDPAVQESSDIIESLQFSTTLATSSRCEFDTIVDNAFGILEKKVNVSLGENKMVTFSVSLKQNETFQLECLPNHNLNKLARHCIGPHFRLQKKPCPEFTIVYSEVLSLTNGAKKDLLYSLFETQTDLNHTSSVTVCVTTYYELMKQLNGVRCISFTAVKWLLLASYICRVAC